MRPTDWGPGGTAPLVAWGSAGSPAHRRSVFVSFPVGKSPRPLGGSGAFRWYKKCVAVYRVYGHTEHTHTFYVCVCSSFFRIFVHFAYCIYLSFMVLYIRGSP